MSIYTTLSISRKAAYRFYVENVLSLSDDELEHQLDNYLEDSLYNAIIVEDSEENDDGILL